MLYKDTKNAWIAGVCAGLADKFGFNPIGIRLIFIIASLASNFIIVLIYLVLALSLKDRPRSAEELAAENAAQQTLNSKAKQLLPNISDSLNNADKRLGKIENYVISERFSFQRQLHDKD